MTLNKELSRRGVLAGGVTVAMAAAAPGLVAKLGPDLSNLNSDMSAALASVLPLYRFFAHDDRQYDGEFPNRIIRRFSDDISAFYIVTDHTLLFASAGPFRSMTCQSLFSSCMESPLLSSLERSARIGATLELANTLSNHHHDKKYTLRVAEGFAHGRWSFLFGALRNREATSRGEMAVFSMLTAAEAPAHWRRSNLPETWLTTNP